MFKYAAVYRVPLLYTGSDVEVWGNVPSDGSVHRHMTRRRSIDSFVEKRFNIDERLQPLCGV